MNRNRSTAHPRVRSFLWIFGALATVPLGVNVWAANDLDTPTVLKAAKDSGDKLKGADTFNTKWLGHNDLQGRVTYQTTVHTYPDGRVIAFAGHFAANPPMLNPLTGNLEQNGTSLVDVTDPKNPVYTQHIPADKGGARMNMICDGSVLPHGIAGHVYLLRENGAVSHEVRDEYITFHPGVDADSWTGCYAQKLVGLQNRNRIHCRWRNCGQTPTG